MSGRQQHIDMAAGIMITWMILGHIESHVGYSGVFFRIGQYLSFFMPWFFYKAGMFYYDRKESIKVRINREGKRLLKPFVVYSLIGQIVYYICLAVEHNVTFRSFVYQPLRSLFVAECLPGNGALWFLIVLFTINILAPYILNSINPMIIAISGISIAFSCYLLSISWFPCIVPNFFAGIVFYVIGYWLRDREKWTSTIIISTLIYILCCYISYPSIYFHHNTATDSVTYLLYFPASIAGIVILNNLCRCVSHHLSFSVFTWIGENAMNLYVTHWIILMALKLVVLDICKIQNTTLIFWIYLTTMVIILPILNKIINYIKVYMN
ncbi:MAG: acyltransferase family protein [Paludibacteraceae bacterium]|nr:acyltransferase family protein [Paludibacteraceae bacterium]